MTTKERTQLTDHFMLYEFTRSGVAIENNIPNIPSQTHIAALKALCEHILEPLRRQFGPLPISSGYRCYQVNLLVGGVWNSQHTKGQAADIPLVTPERGRRMMQFIQQNLDFDQLILEPIGSKTPRWLHVSYTATGKNRHQVVRG